MPNLYTNKSSNIRKTVLLMTVFLVLLIAVGYALSMYFGDVNILYIAIILSIVMNFAAYWWSDKIALSMSRAHAVSRTEAVELYRIVENLCITAGLPLPKIYIMQAAQINAFATGRNPEHAAIAVTTGALQKLNNEELEGVLAHEMSHIGNRDILISSVVVVLAGVIAIVADIGLRMSFFGGRRRSNDNGGGGIGLIIGLAAMIIAPIAATMIRLAVSRQREYLADTSGALLTRYPDGLASALEKIRADHTVMPHTHTATAHLFIGNPLNEDDTEEPSFLAKLFMTHPPLSDRIKRLRETR
ncbi:MAG: M48 family metalloprotease [Patescibacteria group bacterium]